MPVFGYPPEICRRSDGLYSLDPDKFREADEQLAEFERRQEWPLLHGDGTTVETLNKGNYQFNGRRNLIGKKIGVADESEPLKLTA